ncbi:hypothetical protein B1M_06615, partial [Burkholderia sp. TJI49]
MGDGRTRRKAPPERRQGNDANDAHADGQFDLFGGSPDDAPPGAAGAGANSRARATTEDGEPARPARNRASPG